MSQVVLVTAAELASEALEILRASGLTPAFTAERITEPALAERLSRGDVVAVMMRGSPPFTRRVIEAAAGLRVIAKVGSGLDSVDVPAATQLGIALTSAGAASACAVAEHTLALMLSLARDVQRLDRSIRAGAWEQRDFEGREFAARTVGIVGYGRIGQRVAALVSAFGARVLVHPLSGRRTVQHGELEPDFDRLLRESDIVSLHGRLDAGTRGQIGGRELALMKPTAILINTARGALVDEDALAEALTLGKLGGAGLDVFAREPLPSNHPLLAAPNVLCTSHVGAAARETVIRVAVAAAQSIVDYLAGRADRCSLANPDVLASIASSAQS